MEEKVQVQDDEAKLAKIKIDMSKLGPNDPGRAKLEKELIAVQNTRDTLKKATDSIMARRAKGNSTLEPGPHMDRIRAIRKN